MNPANGPAGKKGYALTAGHGDPVMNVLLHLVSVQGNELCMDQDALAELAKPVFAQYLFEFRLTHQNDLQKLLLVRLQVRQKSELLQQVESEVLGLVDDQKDIFALLDSVQKDVVNLLDETASASAFALLAKLGQDGFEELGFRNAGIEYQSAFILLLVYFIDEMAA